MNEIYKFVIQLKKKRYCQNITWNDIKKDKAIPQDFSIEEAKKVLIDYICSDKSKVKSIEYGEGIGDIIHNHIDIFENTTIKKNIDTIINWVENE